MRHRGGPFLPLAERFLHFVHLGALQMAEFLRPALDGRAGERERRQIFRMAVALQNLRRDRRRTQPQLAANIGFNRRIQVRVRADRA